MVVLVFPNQSLDTRSKPLQVSIDAGITIWMSNIDSITHTPDVHRDTRHIAISDRANSFPFLLLRFNIESTMEMVGTWLTKITSKRHLNMYRRAVCDCSKEYSS